MTWVEDDAEIRWSDHVALVVWAEVATWTCGSEELGSWGPGRCPGLDTMSDEATRTAEH